MENNFIHECPSDKDNIKKSSSIRNLIENKSASQNSFENKSESIRNPIGNNNSSSLVSKVYTRTPSKKSQEDDDFLDSEQSNIGFHEIKGKVDKKKKSKLLKLNPNRFKNVNFPRAGDKFDQLINKIDEYIDCQYDTNETQRETNKLILTYLKNQDELNKEIIKFLKKK